ncbi:hypothetical protein B0H10DRAFT_2225030 [Mycena sp. CBHHK59/15]|nr:hypothetical protein B0H10DRAFT_2225030 [Mycena sp. CBHHK59/15]
MAPKDVRPAPRPWRRLKVHADVLYHGFLLTFLPPLSAPKVTPDRRQGSDSEEDSSMPSSAAVPSPPSRRHCSHRARPHPISLASPSCRRSLTPPSFRPRSGASAAQRSAMIREFAERKAAVAKAEQATLEAEIQQLEFRRPP